MVNRTERKIDDNSNSIQIKVIQIVCFVDYFSSEDCLYLTPPLLSIEERNEILGILLGIFKSHDVMLRNLWIPLP